MMDPLIITNIQRMCFHDGPGIRTTVFLKGCSVHCPWCSNPENISFATQEYINEKGIGIYGREYSLEQLLEEIKKDEHFFGQEGGVTFSGGEALMQTKELMPLLEKLKLLGIHVAVETALFVPTEFVHKVVEYIDYFIVDVKMLDKDMCKKVLGGDLDLYFDNIDYLYDNNKINIFRVPLCYEYTFTDDNIARLEEFLIAYNDVPVQIFSIHKLGEIKYNSLGMKAPEMNKVADDDINSLCNKLRNRGIKAEVIRI